MNQSALLSSPTISPKRLAARLSPTVVAAATLWVALAALAWWFVTVPQLFHVEAMARTVDRWIVVRDARWESLGVALMLPPLPTLLHGLLDLVLFAAPEARTLGFAAQLVSVSATVGAAIALQHALRRLGAPRWSRWALTGAFLANPLTVLTAVNGSSQMLFVALTLWAIGHAFALRESVANDAGDGQPRHTEPTLQHTIMIGVAAGLAALTTYAGFLFALLWLAVVWFLGRPLSRERRAAVTILYGLMPLFIVGLWLLGATIALGGPLAPFVGLADTAQRLGIADPTLARLFPESLGAEAVAPALRESVLRAAMTVPVALLLIPIALAFGRRDGQAVILVSVVLTLGVVALLTLLFGASAPPLESLLLAVPVSLALLGWIVARAGVVAVGVITLAIAVASVVVTGWSMAQVRQPGLWPREFVRSLIGAPTRETSAEVWREERSIAARLTELPGRVAIDERLGYRIMFFAGSADGFVTRSSPDFSTMSMKPETAAPYLMVYIPAATTPIDWVGQAAPSLYENGAPWAARVADWPAAGWRLFRTRQLDAPTAPQP